MIYVKLFSLIEFQKLSEKLRENYLQKQITSLLLSNDY